MVKRYAVFAKIPGEPEEMIWKHSKSGKVVPMLFISKAQAIRRGEIWKRRMQKKKIIAKYRIGYGSVGKQDWRIEPSGITFARNVMLGF